MKRALSVLLALVLSLSLVTPTWAAAKTPASGTGNGLTWEKIDNRSTVPPICVWIRTTLRRWRKTLRNMQTPT